MTENHPVDLNEVMRSEIEALRARANREILVGAGVFFAGVGFGIWMLCKGIAALI